MTTHGRFEEIVQVHSTHSSREVNDYLGLGWVMLNVESSQYSEHGWNSVFVLGWKKGSGEVRRPPEGTHSWMSVSTTDKQSADGPQAAS